MNEQTRPDTDAPGLFDTDREIFEEVYEIEIKKTRNKLLIVAGVVLFFDMLALVIANMLVPTTFLITALIPAILTGLAFLALKEPITAVVIAMIIMGGIWVYNVVQLGGAAILSGWLGKAIVIYLLLAALQSAREAIRVKREKLLL